MLALTADGMFHVLRAATSEVRDSVRVMEPIDVSGGYGSYDAPSLAVAEGAAYIGVPAAAQIAEVHLDDVTVARRLNVSGTPSSLAVLALGGGTTH